VLFGQTVPVMQSNFTGGELSPLAVARVDAERYWTSAATMENLIAVPQGPAVRRPGTRFVAATDSNNVARLMGFRYSSDDVYVLEFTDNLMRVYREHGLVLNDDDSIYELATPFDANEITDLQWWQSADTAYIVSGTDWPQKLVRTDHNDWSIGDAEIEDGPFLSENLTATTIAADATTGADVNLVASAAVWSAGHVGSYWKIRDLVGIQTVSATFDDVNDATTALTCQSGGNFQWSVSGSFVGTIDLQISYDEGSTWTAYATMVSTSVASTTDEVYDNDTGQDVQVRAFCTADTSGSASVRVWVHAYMHTGVVQITAVADANHATADVVRDLASTDATVRWSEGAWSGVRGYPRAIASYSDRLVLASTNHQPLTIWFSATAEYESFDAAAGDDADSFGYTLGRAQQDPILWLTAQRRRGLIAGTTGSILEIEPSDSAAGIRPSNPPTISNTLAIAAADLSPVVADNILLVLQRGGKKIREVLYSYDADSLVAPELTLFSEHVTGSGVAEMAWANQPYPILWCVRSDGSLASCTYDRNFQTVSWSRHTLGGSGVVESICTVPGTTEDELWLSVRRTIGGSTVRYVEYMAPWDFGSDPNDVYYVDCGLTYDSAAATTFTNLDHLEGQTLAVCADGAAADDEMVASGSVTLDHAASVVHAGLPYTSTLTTVRYDLPGQQGATWHRRKAIGQVTVSFYQTLGAKIGPTAALAQAIDWQAGSAGVLTGGAVALYSGDKDLSLSKSFATDAASVTIVQAEPLPMTVRAIVAIVEIR